MTNSSSSPFVGLRSFVVRTEAGNQALVQLCPFCIGLDRSPDDEIHNSFRFTRATLSQSGFVVGATRLLPLGCPAEIGFQIGSTRKIGNRTDDSKKGRSEERTNRRDGSEDLSLSALNGDLADFLIELLQMLLDEPQFFNQQALFTHETALPGHILGTDTLRSKLLQVKQAGIGCSLSHSYCDEGSKTRCGKSMGRRKFLAERQCCCQVRIFQDFCEFWNVVVPVL